MQCLVFGVNITLLTIDFLRKQRENALKLFKVKNINFKKNTLQNNINL